jgi:electron transfer flavoprotein alpha subunit
MAKGFLVFLENRNGRVKKGSLEALSTARSLADTLGADVKAVVFGEGDAEEKAARCGAGHLHKVVVNPAAESRDLIIGVLASFVQAETPEYVFASATAMGRDVLPGVAARFQTSVIQDVTEIIVSDGGLQIKRPIYAGKAFEVLKPLARPTFVTLRPNVFPLVERPAQPAVAVRNEAAAEDRIRSVTREVREKAAGKVELTEARVIVSGGRGIKGPEHYKLIEDLAEVMGAAAGASRAIVDAGWVDHQHQVGQTGKTVSPTLYIAVGISGAIQHMAGMSSSKYIVAINKDPDAPIFKVANYGIVGDLFKVVPLLTEELRKRAAL